MPVRHDPEALTLAVSNGPATNVTVTDVLPVGLDAPTAISDGGTYNAGTRTITWNLASVSNGKQLTYTATVASDAPAGALVNTATIVGCDPAQTQGGCSDTSTVIVRVPGISIDKSNDTTGPVI